MASAQRNAWRVAQWIGAAVIVVFAALALRGQWARSGDRLLSLRPDWVALGAATAVVLGTYALLIETWRRVVGAWNSHMPRLAAVRIWFVSSLAKYIPGNIWSIAVMSVMARGHGVSSVAATGSSVLMSIVSVAVGLGVVLVTGAGMLPNATTAAVTALALFAGLLAAPAIVRPLAARAAALTGRQIVVPDVPATTVWLAAAGTLVSWVTYGIGFMLFTRAVLGQATGGVVPYIAVYTAAYVIGFITPVAPAGLVVREGVITAAMPALGLASSADALVVALASRVWLTALEVVPGLLALIILRQKPTGKVTSS